MNINKNSLKSLTPNRDNVGRWSKIILLPFFCYFPAYLLVLFSFKSFEALIAKKAEQPSDSATLEQKVVALEKQVGIKEDPTKNSLDDRVNSLSTQIAIKNGVGNVQTNDVNKEYVAGLIEKEARAQADKAAADTIDKAKSELLGQISFPVIFAIASIFAAFAVKDILTEILKDEERKRVKQELEKELASKIERQSKILGADFEDRFTSTAASIGFLEYEFLINSALQVASTITLENHLDEEKTLDRLIEESNIALNRAISGLDLPRKRHLLQTTYTVYQAKISDDSKQLTPEQRDMVLDRLRIAKLDAGKHLDNTLYSPLTSLYDLQIDMYIHTLKNIKTSGSTTLSSAQVDSLIVKIQKTRDDIIADMELRGKIAQKFADDDNDQI